MVDGSPKEVFVGFSKQEAFITACSPMYKATQVERVLVKRKLDMSLGLHLWLDGKESVCQCRSLRRCEFDTWVGKIPWRRKWQTAPVFLPGEPQGQMSLAGYGTLGCKEQRGMS